MTTSRWRKHRKFSKWAKGRPQLEVLRTGWAHAGPWFDCTDAECPGRTEYEFDDHCHSVLEGDGDAGPWTLHLCVYADTARKTMIALCISDIDPTTGKRMVRVAQ